MAVDPWSSSTGRMVRRQCFERDKAAGAPCWLCGRPIDYALGMSTRGGSVWAWEGDHEKPQDLFPELVLEPSNIRPSHVRCNRKRGKRAAMRDELGKPSRVW